MLLALGALHAPAFSNSVPLIVQEEKVRAAVAVGIIRYTQWQTPLDETLELCLLGRSDSFAYIRALDNKTIAHGKPLQVIELSSSDFSASVRCDVVIFGEPTGAVPPLQLPESSLLICDGCKKLAERAAVVLTKDNHKIRFDVYLSRAKAQRVTFRAAMLELAATVEGLDE